MQLPSWSAAPTSCATARFRGASGSALRLRALVREPMCLLDEPLSNLDAELQSQMRLELKALHARVGGTMVHVTHDQAEALVLGDRVAVLRAGVIEQVGAPDELWHEPANAFVAGFVGAPSMNIVSSDGPLHVEGLPEEGGSCSGCGPRQCAWPPFFRGGRCRRGGRRGRVRACRARRRAAGRSRRGGLEAGSRSGRRDRGRSGGRVPVRPGHGRAGGVDTAERRRLLLLLAPYLLGLALLVLAPALVTVGLS